MLVSSSVSKSVRKLNLPSWQGLWLSRGHYQVYLGHHDTPLPILANFDGLSDFNVLPVGRSET